MKASTLVGLLAGTLFLSACRKPISETTPPSSHTEKTAVLIVSHGSHSESWRSMLLDIESQAEPDLLASPHIDDVRSAFMEYTEPSIATRLKEFDSEGFTHVILVPVLLTVSDHSFDDIPVIAGMREDPSTQSRLQLEGIETYQANAAVTLTPLLDFPDLLHENIARRAAAMSSDPTQEGLVLVAYGSEPYNAEWTQLVTELGQSTCQKLGFPEFSFAWCGHIAHYQSEPTQQAIEQILTHQKRALVVPLLVAIDENFQGRIIGGAVDAVAQPDRVAYRHDAVLPDARIPKWVVETSLQHAAQRSSGQP
ncbi:sirohydrochlorin ferrochelatase [Haloferula luteola]|uniref:Sirohydrochlorin ferrochelatase n=1 Tax=Haloferula luteola TaxID=595692 RepID=A0A840V3W8_9BACT|nr:CbiX/SirB N-terminal domain-containing protein [Haloferula luteola]MBB5352705.1 sirohydrochlorin ferrochelatase [Haloferula luteola]